ncbi:MAG: sulfurtransferase [Gammaproteobacteria bacterium]
MNYTTLVSADSLYQHLDDTDWIVLDCRFTLADADAGIQSYRKGHIPTARYAHLNKDLSSAVTGYSGRHPLPSFSLLAQKLGRWGASNRHQLVAYDDAAGAFAGRLWWLLRCMGHQNVAVLDGGIQHWQRQGYPVTPTLPAASSSQFRPYVDQNSWLGATDVRDLLAAKAIKLIDARSLERFRGNQEPIDPIAGHIPGAVNRPFQLNLNRQGQFLSAGEIRQQFERLLAGTPPEKTIHMCGSGVTACHNLLAMEYAGLSGSKLYAGSWSDWIKNKNRAIAKDV